MSRSPSSCLGQFVDDYGAWYEITADRWTRLPAEHHDIRRWNVAAGYLVARNDAANEHAAGLWTRIDWVLLPDAAPYEWGYCLSAYEAPTMAAAESTITARPEQPRTGCNGYPFTRMRRVGPPQRMADR